MHLEELRKIIGQGESTTLEFKKTTGQRTEAAKAICAFLNGIGGFVLFGVSDKGEMLGQQVTAKTLEDIAIEIKRIEPPVFPEIETVALGNSKAIVAIRVSGKMGTYCYDGRPYIRHGPITQIMPREEYEKRILDKFHAHRRWENEVAPDWVTVKDLDEEEIQITLQNAVKLGRMKQPAHTDTESILRGLGLFDGGHLINAAVVLYGKSERLFSSYPQLVLRLARFRGSDRLSGFMDNREYWGHAFDLLRRSELFLLDHLPITGKLIPGKIIREDYPLYPPLAIREAVANAICHRDYTIPGGAVSMAIYDDHLEMINPGSLHFDMTPEKLAAPHESKPWNPIIASVFYRAGIIEKWGMGTLSIIDWCQENNNPRPIWEVRTQSVITKFFPSKTFLQEERLQEQKGPELGSDSLEDKLLKLLEKGPVSKSELVKYLGHKHVSGGLKKLLQYLLKRKVIAYTIPKKPNSRLQKYKKGQKFEIQKGPSEGPSEGPSGGPSGGPSQATEESR